MYWVYNVHYILADLRSGEGDLTGKHLRTHIQGESPKEKQVLEPFLNIKPLTLCNFATLLQEAMCQSKL